MPTLARDPLRSIESVASQQGAIAIIVTSAERAADLAQAAVTHRGVRPSQRHAGAQARNSRWGPGGPRPGPSRRQATGAGRELTHQDVEPHRTL